MRIGVDMIAVQSPGSQGRGIGRYARGLIGGLLRSKGRNEFVLYCHEALPAVRHPGARTVVVPRTSPPSPMERVVVENPDGLDALLVISPFEQFPWYRPPTRGVGGVRLWAVLHDLIPFQNPDRYLNDRATGPESYRRLEALRRYDGLLTNSESTRADALRILGLAGDRVVSIGGGAEAGEFWPERGEATEQVRAGLGRLGITRPFVFSVSGSDPRKNPRGLIEGFGMLPAEIRRGHQLVIACAFGEEERRGLEMFAEEMGLGEGELVLTGGVDEGTLRMLYQRCAGFAFPSRYEGLGLPLIEAMRCGAAVLAGENSSQPEVVGGAGLLVDVGRAEAIAGGLARILGEPGLREVLGRKAVERAAGLTWERSARLATGAIEGVVGRRKMRRSSERPRIAVFSPWSPKGTGIATYAERLVEALGGRYAIDLYHEGGYVPEVGLGSSVLACHDHRLFGRLAGVKKYEGVLYQMGNSRFHTFLYPHLLETPGVVTLHDLNLAAFHFERAARTADFNGTYREEIWDSHPGRWDEIEPRLEAWGRERGGWPQALARRGLHMNRRVLAHAKAVIVHSPWCVEEVRRVDPGLAGKLVVVPMGATAREVGAEERARTRARFRIPGEALVFGAFGILARSKMNVEAIGAFAEVSRRRPESVFVLAGEDYEDGEAKREVARLGLGERVMFLGRVSDGDFADLIGAVDVGVCLRRPPTYGETSAALLDLLRHGVATIVTDVATFGDFPGSVVRKVGWPGGGMEALEGVFVELAEDRGARERLGREALRYVRERHDWAIAARGYAEVLEGVARGVEGLPWARSA